MKVITFSRQFPVKHPKAGQPTFFREKIWAGLADIFRDWKIPDEITDWDWHEYYNGAPKYHTIRSGNRWKVGDQFSPRVWSGKPYRSKQIEIAPPITIEKIWEILIKIEDGEDMTVLVDGRRMILQEWASIALNDGLALSDFANWFNAHPKRKEQVFTGQILCWNPHINY